MKIINPLLAFILFSILTSNASNNKISYKKIKVENELFSMIQQSTQNKSKWEINAFYASQAQDHKTLYSNSKNEYEKSLNNIMVKFYECIPETQSYDEQILVTGMANPFFIALKALYESQQ